MHIGTRLRLMESYRAERVRGLPGYGVDELLADVVHTGETAERDRARTLELLGALAGEG